MKVIGCGNADRGDDRAGLLVAERLREEGIDTQAHTGEPFMLIQSWQSGDDIILVDTVVTGAAAGTVHVWNSRPAHIASGTPASSHGFDIGQAMKLAEALGRLPARLRVYGIEGQQFDIGSSISPEVECAIEWVVRHLRAAMRFQN